MGIMPIGDIVEVYLLLSSTLSQQVSCVKWCNFQLQFLTSCYLKVRLSTLIWAGDYNYMG
jgi:hypothetical protein